MKTEALIATIRSLKLYGMTDAVGQLDVLSSPAYRDLASFDFE
jgi:hypothetical protein